MKDRRDIFEDYEGCESGIDTTPQVSSASEKPGSQGENTTGEKDLSFAHKIGFSTGQTVLLHMLRHRIDAALERLYQETPPNFDDSLTGINAAWDAVRGVLKAMVTPAVSPEHLDNSNVADEK